jgi:predicted phage-related endonuclease
MAMTIQEIQELTEKRQEYKRMEEEAKILRESIDDQLKAAMLEMDQDTIFAGPFKLTYKEESKNLLDQKRLKEEQEEIYMAYVNLSSYRKFLVK